MNCPNHQSPQQMGIVLSADNLDECVFVYSFVCHKCKTPFQRRLYSLAKQTVFQCPSCQKLVRQTHYVPFAIGKAAGGWSSCPRFCPETVDGDYHVDLIDEARIVSQLNLNRDQYRSWGRYSSRFDKLIDLYDKIIWQLHSAARPATTSEELASLSQHVNNACPIIVGAQVIYSNQPLALDSKGYLRA